MTSSDATLARQQLEKLVRVLDPQHLKNVIDVPMDTAADRLLQQRHQPASASEFNRTISSFVRELCAEASQAKHILSKEESFATAVQILNQCYGSPGQGYSEAVVDFFLNGSQTIDAILQTLAEALKAREKANYIAWRQQVCLESLSWSAKCALVQLITQRHQTSTGEPFFEGGPERFAGELRNLVTAHLSAVHATTYCGTEMPFSSPD